MSGLARGVVMMTMLLSLLGVLSPSSGAVTWDNAGDTAFTATGGPAWLTGTDTSVIGSHFDLTCNSADVTAVTSAAPFTGVVWPAFHGTSTYAGCHLTIVGTVRFECGWTFTALTQSGAVTSGTVASTCDLATNAGQVICHLAGTGQATYTNPTVMTYGTVTLAASTLTATNTTTMCVMGNNAPVDSREQTLQLTTASGGALPPHRGPIITRTP